MSWNEASYYTLLTNSYIFKLGNYSMAVWLYRQCHQSSLLCFSSLIHSASCFCEYGYSCPAVFSYGWKLVAWCLLRHDEDETFQRSLEVHVCVCVAAPVAN